MSRDGLWLAYATTAQGVDGELIVRNLQSGQEYRHPRGINPQITPDATFVVFTIAQSKADEERQRQQERRAGARGQARGGENQADAARTPVRTSAGIHVAGQWSGNHRRARRQRKPSRGIVDVGRALSGDGRRGPRRRARRPRARTGRWPSGASAIDTGSQHVHRPTRCRRPKARRRPAGVRRRRARSPRLARPRPRPCTRRKESGSDLILRNLVSGQEVTVPLVSDFEWNRDGSWIAYGVSSAKAEEDGAFARQMSDGSVPTLLKGKGNYKAFGFAEDGRQLAFLSDQAEYDKDVAPYRVLLLEVLRRLGVRALATATRGMPSDLVVSDQGDAGRSRRTATRLYLGTAPPPTPTPRRKARPSRAA